MKDHDGRVMHKMNAKSLADLVTLSAKLGLASSTRRLTRTEPLNGR